MEAIHEQLQLGMYHKISLPNTECDDVNIQGHSRMLVSLRASCNVRAI